MWTGLADSKRQVHRTDVATSPPTMWTAASSEIVACYYAHATRTVYRLEQHNPRSPTPTRVDERQQGPELSQRSGLELDGRHGSLRRQARRQGPGNAVLFRSRSVSWIPAADERLDNSRLPQEQADRALDAQAFPARAGATHEEARCSPGLTGRASLPVPERANEKGGSGSQDRRARPHQRGAGLRVFRR